MIYRTLGFVAMVCVVAGLLQAHHSLAGVYDMKGKKELSGTVTSVRFTNPHGSLALAVKNQDRPSTKRGHAPRIRHGARPARDRQHRTECAPYRGRDQSEVFAGGFLKTVIMPDGRVIQISAGNPND